MRIFFVLSVVLGLSGCLATTPAGLLSGKADVKQVNVLQGQITVAGPKGYCVASESVHDMAATAFVPLVPCASSRQSTDPRFILSVAAQPMQSDLPLEAKDLVSTARSALDGGAMQAALGGDAEILTYRGEGQALVAQTRATHPMPGLSPVQWRAIFMRKGHVVALSVNGIAGDALPADAGEPVLLAFLQKMQSVNADKAKAPAVLPKFFRRLLN